MKTRLQLFLTKPDKKGRKRIKIYLAGLILICALVIGYAYLLDGRPLYRYRYNLFLTTNVPEQLNDVFFRFYPDKFMYRPETGLMPLMPAAESDEPEIMKMFQHDFYRSDKKFTTGIFSLLPMPPPEKIVVTFLDADSKPHKLETGLDLSNSFHGTLGLIIFYDHNGFTLKKYINENQSEFENFNAKNAEALVNTLISSGKL